MNINSHPQIENIIRAYLDTRERFIYFGKKKLDAEKEYNKLLSKYDGGEKQYSLAHANNIYKAYCDMLSYSQESIEAQESFMENEEKLREIGKILFEASIHCDINMAPSINGQEPVTRNVMITYNNGQVIVS